MLDLVEGVLSEFADAQGHAKWRFDFGELPARRGGCTPQKLAQQKAHYVAHKAEILAKRREYYRENKARLNAYRREYYEANRATEIANAKKWQTEHKKVRLGA